MNGRRPERFRFPMQAQNLRARAAACVLSTSTLLLNLSPLHAAQTPQQTAAHALVPDHPPEVPPGAPWQELGPPGLVLAARPHATSPIVGGYLGLGEFVLDAEDMRVPGVGLDYVFARRYRSRSQRKSELGVGWDHSYNIYVVARGADLQLHDGNGRVDLFRRLMSGAFTAPGQFLVGAQNVDGSFTFEFPDDGRWNLAPLDGSPAAGKLTSVVDRNGNQLTFVYDGLGRLSTVTDTLQRTYTYAYSAAGWLSSVTDHLGRSLAFSHYAAGDPLGAPGDLRTVRTPVVTGTPNGNDYPNGKTTTYTYSVGQGDRALNHNLLTIVAPDGVTVLRNVYSSATARTDLTFDRIIRQELGAAGDPQVVTYAAIMPPPMSQLPPRVVATVNDRVGNVSEHVYDDRSRLVLVREYTGRAQPGLPVTATTNRPTGKLRSSDPDSFQTRYAYGLDWLVTRIERPELDVLVLEYDRSNTDPRARANVLQRTRLPGPRGASQSALVETLTYSAQHQLVQSHTDARGNVTIHTYDAAGNRTRTTHREPAVVEDWEYDSRGRLTAHVLPADATGFRRRDVRTYYPLGHASSGWIHQSIVDAGAPSVALSLTTTFEYDGAGNVSRVQSPRDGASGRSYEHNALNQLVRELRPDLATPTGSVRYERLYWYDARDRLERIDELDVNAEGVVEPHGYLTTSVGWSDRYEHRPVEIARETAPGQVEREGLEYDRKGNLTARLFEAAVSGARPGNRTVQAYDERDFLFQRTTSPLAPNRSTTQVDYDGNGNLVAVRRGLEAGARVEVFTYDGFDRRTATVDAMGNDDTLVYDPNGNVITRILSGELLDAPGSAGNVRLAEVEFTYDALDRRTEARQGYFDPATQASYSPAVAVQRYEYDGLGGIVAEVDALGSRMTTSWDRAHRPSIVRDALQNEERLTRDANGNVLERTVIHKDGSGGPDAAEVMQWSYDALERVATETTPAGTTRSVRYSSRSDEPAWSSDDLGNVERHSFDGLGRRLQRSQELRAGGVGGGALLSSRTTDYTWSQLGLLASATDDNGHTTTFLYDDDNRLIQVQRADGTIERCEFDAHGDRSAVEDRNRTRVVSTFDALSRVSQRSVAAVLPSVALDTTLETYLYDGRSLLVHAENDTSLVQRQYDSLGALRLEALTADRAGSPTLGVTQILTDAVGAATRVVYPGGRTIDVARDVLHRPAALTDGAVGITSIRYLGPERVGRLVASNGAVTLNGFDAALRPSATSTVFDPAGQNVSLVQRTITWSGWQRLEGSLDHLPLGSTYAYDRDSIGRILTSTESGPVQRVIQYALDDIGNRTSVVGGPFAGAYTMSCSTPVPADCQVNQYTTTGFDARAYDDVGNLVRRDPQGPVLERFGYDFAQRLVTVTLQPSGRVDRYAYDALGRRIREVQNSGGNALDVRRYFLGRSVIEEQSATGTTQRTYLRGPSVLAETSAGVTHFLHSDPRGHIVGASDAVGALVERYEYGDHGQLFVRAPGGQPRASSAIGNVYGFNGLRFDAVTRVWSGDNGTIYDPTVGRTFSGGASATARGLGYSDPDDPDPPQFPIPVASARAPMLGSGVIHHGPSDTGLSITSDGLDLYFSSNGTRGAGGSVVHHGPSDTGRPLTDDGLWLLFSNDWAQGAGNGVIHHGPSDEDTSDFRQGSELLLRLWDAELPPYPAPLARTQTITYSKRQQASLSLIVYNGHAGQNTGSALDVSRVLGTTALGLGVMMPMPWPPSDDGSWLTANGVTNLPWLNGTWLEAGALTAGIMKPWDEDTTELWQGMSLAHVLR